jgi:alpha-L-rhamnosidase
MNKTILSMCMALQLALIAAGANASEALYPAAEDRKPSPGQSTYYIDPVGGSDSQSGLRENRAWRSFRHVNQLLLAPGDRVKVLRAGSFDQTLMLTGAGTEEAPIEIVFAPGPYDFYPAHALTPKYQISNTNGDPDTGKAIGILVHGASHVKISGPGAQLFYHGKMIEVCIDGCQNIIISDLHFDYHRPTVSEFSVAAVGEGYVDLKIHRDSQYSIENGNIMWQGEGWSYSTGLAQELDLSTNDVWRRRDPLAGMFMEEIEPFLLRARGKHNMKRQHVYQIRNTHRDCAGAFTRRSKNISWKNVHFRYLHGMGLVNQFSENLTFDTVSIAPDEKSGRTTAAWADCIQVSGCRGKLLVKDCVFSGAHDDAINIHGTHLRVVECLSETQIKVRFMHAQTFGFMAFNPGDQVTFVHWDSLACYGANQVTQAEKLNPKELLLTLKDPVPTAFRDNDAVENVTWTPEVEIRGCTIKRIPTRGFLITTRRRVLVENNTFHNTHMSAILLEDDAKGWFESGCVRDMTIRGNRFVRCAEPVIHINPQNSVPNDAVHQNIRIQGNDFLLRSHASVKASSAKGLTITGNTMRSAKALTDDVSIQTRDCSEVEIARNRYVPVKQLPLPGQLFAVAGCTAFLILPDKVAPGMPWIWYAPTLKGLPEKVETWMFERFLDAGMAIAGVDVGESYGSPQGRAAYSALYRELVDQRGLSKKACLLARSRGGLMLYSWCADHPACVACIAGIYPVCNLSSYPGLARACAAYGMTEAELAASLTEHNPIDRLGPLAQAGVPIFHIHGDTDTVVPLDKNSALVKARYDALGGDMTLEVVPGQGHNMWSGWFHSQDLVDFVIANANAGRAGQVSSVSVTDLRCEYLSNPLGVDVELPRFSWKLVDANKTRGQKQTAYQIVVETDAAPGTGPRITFWDSGRVDSSASVNNVYAGRPLASNQNCFWKVRIWDKDGQVTAWSPEARFSVGLLNPSDWQGEWIRYKEADNIKHIWYRKRFSLEKLPGLAFVHLASIGYHELYVNGQRIGTRVLSPGVTNLEKRALYVTYDVTSHLAPGDNVVAVWTGPGWARADGSYGKGVWKQDSIFKCQIHMSNGPSLCSDTSWKCRVSSSENLGLWKGGGKGEYGGELIDARRHVPEWNRASYDDEDWAHASSYSKAITLSAEMMEPDRKVETLRPVAMTEDKGLYTFDMGKNFTGWLEVKLGKGKAGQIVKFMTANQPGKTLEFKQESHYIHDASGTGTFCHRFNYMAGRWISIKGLSYRPDMKDVTCYIVTNDRKRTGHFDCSNALFNRIYETDLDTYIANTVNGVLMDCPHRERYGYGEVSFACMWGCGIPNYESAAFYTKATRDWFDVQREDGFVNTIAPQVYRGAGGTLWSSAPVTMTWEFYRAYGDQRQLAQAYGPMKKWLDYLHGYVGDEGVLTAYTGASRFLGDWATPHGSEYGNIPAAKLFNNCVYAYNLNVFVQAARILGKPEVAALYVKRLAELRENAHAHFFNEETKTYIDGRQLSLAFPLYTGITPAHERDAVFSNFVQEIVTRKPYLDTGSPGLPILLKYIIEQVERPDLLVHCLTRTEQPSYGYFLDDGQTTWPEYWQIVGHDSKIHTCYTSIAGYFIKGIGGIRPDAQAYGMQSFILKPKLIGDLTYANTTSASLYGPMVSNWSRSGSTGTFHFEVPPNASAKAYIPAEDVRDVSEAGRPVTQAEGVTFLGQEGAYAVFSTGSGRYDFSSSSVPKAN